MSSYTKRQVYGDAILERLSRSSHAATLKKETQAYKAIHGQFTTSCAAVAAAQQQRDDALAAVGTADDELDQTLLELADGLVGAGLGRRQNPFAAYSRYSPAVLTTLAYASEEKAVRKLLVELRKKKLVGAVAAAVKAVATAADAVAGALKSFGGPQADYEAARQARDALLLDWNKALARLKRSAAVAYDEDRAGYRALFATTAGKLRQAPKRPRKKAPQPPAAKPPSATT